jgi:hypothetical protein
LRRGLAASAEFAIGGFSTVKRTDSSYSASPSRECVRQYGGWFGEPILNEPGKREIDKKSRLAFFVHGSPPPFSRRAMGGGDFLYRGIR